MHDACQNHVLGRTKPSQAASRAPHSIPPLRSQLVTRIAVVGLLPATMKSSSGNATPFAEDNRTHTVKPASRPGSRANRKRQLGSATPADVPPQMIATKQRAAALHRSWTFKSCGRQKFAVLSAAPGTRVQDRLAISSFRARRPLAWSRKCASAVLPDSILGFECEAGETSGRRSCWSDRFRVKDLQFRRVHQSLEGIRT